MYVLADLPGVAQCVARDLDFKNAGVLNVIK